MVEQDSEFALDVGDGPQALRIRGARLGDRCPQLRQLVAQQVGVK